MHGRLDYVCTSWFPEISRSNVFMCRGPMQLIMNGYGWGTGHFIPWQGIKLEKSAKLKPSEPIVIELLQYGRQGARDGDTATKQRKVPAFRCDTGTG